jgi:hypothetical protein
VLADVHLHACRPAIQNIVWGVHALRSRCNSRKDPPLLASSCTNCLSDPFHAGLSPLPFPLIHMQESPPDP